MKYTMKVTIYNPDTPAGMTSDLLFIIDCNFAYDPEQYGNGYMLRLKKRGIEGFQNFVDLRYDAEFNPNDKPAYLEKWARSYWSGKDGAYAVKALSITKVE